MMGQIYGSMMGGGYGFGGLIGDLLGLSFLAFLILGCIYFWKGINKK